MILIGSRALALRNKNLLKRKPLDFDWICTRQEYDKWIETDSFKVNPKKIHSEMNDKKMIVQGDVNCEFEFIEPGNSCELLFDLVNSDSKTIETPFGLVPNLDLLFTIKSSHKFKKFSSIYGMKNFYKTLTDYHMMENSGAKIRDGYLNFLKLREKESYDNQTHPKLNVSKTEFFNEEENGIKQIYDHDEIHKVVAIEENIPAYTYYLKEGSAVLCDKDKFFSLPEEIRINGVIEESCVLALERSKIPFPDAMTSDQAFVFALAKVCTTITSGFFRNYAYLNALKVLNKYPKNYYEKFLNAVEKAIIKKL
jgi:hypothetical protein